MMIKLKVNVLVALDPQRGYSFMSVTFKLKSYDNEITEFTLNKAEEVKHIVLLTLTGDEVVYVFYNDGTRKEFDSSKTFRNMNLFDDVQVLTLEELQELH